MPLHVRARLSYFNVPVVGGTTDPASALGLLKEVATADDFVAIKIDIDGGPELEIVRQIVADESVAALIDELYFEYHFYFDGLNFGWATHARGEHHSSGMHDVDDALRLMRRLRERGIRAHFWV